jgi:hypothetical protein
MENFEFEWDDEKAESNLKKHDVSFDEAATIFNDPNIATLADPDHSVDEERYVSLGVSVMMCLLSVSHTYRKERIRIINARKTTSAEKKNYENY